MAKFLSFLKSLNWLDMLAMGITILVIWTIISCNLPDDFLVE